jgi:hypothetical protein
MMWVARWVSAGGAEEPAPPFAGAVPAPGAHVDHSGMAGIVKTVKTTPLLTLADES